MSNFYFPDSENSSDDSKINHVVSFDEFDDSSPQINNRLKSKKTLPLEDERRNFPKLIEDTLNTSDQEVTKAILERICTTDCVLVFDRPKDRFSGKRYLTEYYGTNQIVFFFSAHQITIPDSLFLIHDCKYVLNWDESCKFNCKYSYSGSKLYHMLNPLDKNKTSYFAQDLIIDKMLNKYPPNRYSFDSSSSKGITSRPNFLTFQNEVLKNKYDNRKRLRISTIGQFVVYKNPFHEISDESGLSDAGEEEDEGEVLDLESFQDEEINFESKKKVEIKPPPLNEFFHINDVGDQEEENKNKIQPQTALSNSASMNLESPVSTSPNEMSISYSFSLSEEEILTINYKNLPKPKAVNSMGYLKIFVNPSRKIYKFQFINLIPCH